MKPSMLTRKVATLRATMWLNSFSDALDSGVLCINPGLSQERATEITRELTSFRGQLLRIRSELDMPAEVYATVHLRQWQGDAISSAVPGDYPLAMLLDEQERFRQGEGSV